MSTFDFQDGNGPVPAKRHINPDGSEGGWVADTAQVFGNAWVSGNARVFDTAQVFGTAWVADDARVYGDALVSGNAQVSGNARVFGNTQVFDDAQVFGDAWVFGDARVSDTAQVSGNAQVSGDALIRLSTDLINGFNGFYQYTVYATTDGIVLQYGCETRSLKEWNTLQEDGRPFWQHQCDHHENKEHYPYFVFALAATGLLRTSEAK